MYRIQQIKDILAKHHFNFQDAEQTISDISVLLPEVEKQISELQEKLESEKSCRLIAQKVVADKIEQVSRRNMQIAELKKDKYNLQDVYSKRTDDINRLCKFIQSKNLLDEYYNYNR